MATKRTNGEGSITLAKDGRWTARIQIGKNPNGSARIKAFYGKTKTEATKKMREYQHQNNSANIDYAKDSFDDYILRWFELYKSRSLRPTSYDRNEGIIRNQLIPFFGYLQLGNVSVDHIQKYMNKLQDDGYSYTTLEKSKHLLNGCFKYALTKQDVKYNPVSGVVMPSRDGFETKEIIILDEDDMAKFISYATQTHSNGEPVYRYGHGLVFMMYTGLRLGEALALKWSDINLETRIVNIKGNAVTVKNRVKADEEDPNFIVKINNPKTKRGLREVYMSQTAVKAILNLKNTMKPTKESEYVFATASGKIVGKRNVQRTVTSISTKADLSIPHCNVHALRHTFASMLFRKGVDIKTISALLGHSNVNFTYNRYVHLIQEQKYSAIDLLDTL